MQSAISKAVDSKDKDEGFIDAVTKDVINDGDHSHFAAEAAART